MSTENTVYAITTVSNPCGFGETFGNVDIIVLVLGNELESESALTVYPNPTADELRIEMNDKSIQSIYIQLFNSIGLSILEQNLLPSYQTIDLSTLNSGSYLLRLNVGPYVYHRKVIVNH